ncbi:MAG: ATPase, T2SS/T4P/T4SS family [bacterium]|nr:ATPase, T2SS/T4P/T4SS family [bacterium]
MSPSRSAQSPLADPIDTPVPSPGVEDQELNQLSQLLKVSIQESLSGWLPDKNFLEAFSISYCRQRKLLGFTSATDSEIQVAICNHSGWQQLDTVSRMLRRSVRPVLASGQEIQAAINSAFTQRESNTHQLIAALQPDSLLLPGLDSGSEDLLNNGGRAPVIQLVNQLLFDAVLAGASDIHIQPADDHVLVRQRIDGVLFDCQTIPKSIQEEVLTRIKVLGRMNIAEKRLPQDGRATVELGNRVVDLRIASLPTSHNERIVIRLLDKSARLYTLGELGMSANTLAQWRTLIRRDHGLILVTGPTGSGKSTTLYSALQEINSKELNVLTLEDPIEYQLDGISQSQINEKKGMTFASGMRSVLRQDPDIIMVGEIRDRDTASMAIQASLTGHLVFSTLHTNDAASAVTRLLDLGVEPYLLASSMIASLAQRLVRRLCTACRRSLPSQAGDGVSPTTVEQRAGNRPQSVDVFEPVGCEACRYTGFRGRLGLFELLILNDECRELIQNRANASQIRNTALRDGMTLLARDGVAKARAGQTILAEVLRATTLESEVD